MSTMGEDSPTQKTINFLCEYMLEQINVFLLGNTNTPINGYVQYKDATQRQR